ncbi:Protein of unknown function [Gryllus bimaculatus]|nr:Protein of unknown function [Gryllus bimaculatus]
MAVCVVQASGALADGACALPCFRSRGRPAPSARFCLPVSQPAEQPATAGPPCRTVGSVTWCEWDNGAVGLAVCVGPPAPLHFRGPGEDGMRTGQRAERPVKRTNDDAHQDDGGTAGMRAGH